MARKNKRRSVSVNVTSSTASRVNEFNPDYTHVKRDLTRIGTLAGFFFVALIVLSFFIK